MQIKWTLLEFFCDIKIIEIKLGNLGCLMLRLKTFDRDWNSNWGNAFSVFCETM